MVIVDLLPYPVYRGLEIIQSYLLGEESTFFMYIFRFAILFFRVEAFGFGTAFPILLRS